MVISLMVYFFSEIPHVSFNVFPVPSGIFYLADYCTTDPLISYGHDGFPDITQEHPDHKGGDYIYKPESQVYIVTE